MKSKEKFSNDRIKSTEDNRITNTPFGKEKELNVLKDIYAVKGINIDVAWEKLSSKINNKAAEINTSYDKSVIIRSLITKAAAVLLIIVSLGIIAIYLKNSDYFNNSIILETNNNSKNLQVNLPDGSIIYLNNNSKLSYGKDFGEKSRDVKLTGEAFFEISPDKAKPFCVNAGNAKIKVVGTSFNVMTKNKESAVEVFVEEGVVNVTDKSGSKLITIDPGFIGIMSQEVTNKSINTNPNYMAWNTNLLIYNGQNLNIVLSDIKKVYNTNIIADDQGILEYTWTTRIDNQPLDTVLKLLCASFNLEYRKDNNIYHLVNK